MKIVDRWVVVGAGAVGGYIAGHLAAAGHEVGVIEPWAAHAEAIAKGGLAIEEPSARLVARLPVLRGPDELPLFGADMVVLCTKIPDASAWVERIEREGHFRGTYLVTLNALADYEVGRMVGNGRVMGCIVAGLFAELVEPGRIVRHKDRHKPGPPLFQVGELAGPASLRVTQCVQKLGIVDGAKAIDDLLSARWTKLLFNAMTSPLCAVSGVPTREMFLTPALRAELMAIGMEVAALAAAAGATLGPNCAVPGADWIAAAQGDAAARQRLEAGLIRYGEGIGAGATSGMAQDLKRGRRTEVDSINGIVVAEAERLGLAVPVNRAIIARMHAAEAARASR
ncbi:MAG: 2-dehydropantoate 2-reductase [Alphaproteobacteria bacterium]|nr:2-dehydropantoate 2-reductase [Alphaproteobacteria bacterium]